MRLRTWTPKNSASHPRRQRLPGSMMKTLSSPTVLQWIPLTASQTGEGAPVPLLLGRPPSRRIPGASGRSSAMQGPAGGDHWADGEMHVPPVGGLVCWRDVSPLNLGSFGAGSCHAEEMRREEATIDATSTAEATSHGVAGRPPLPSCGDDAPFPYSSRGAAGAVEGGRIPGTLAASPMAVSSAASGSQRWSGASARFESPNGPSVLGCERW
mmetsp:Transcript_26222/g.66718  ORF Transcript_26222/g.66718 Transcript_26222/m.66718 type:complete len:212 (-) Transcript_26222:412-1047(-)